MTRVRRPSPQATAVLLSLAEDRTAWSYGYELCQRLGIKPGTMYPILMQLADRGFLETGWENGPPPGRPPRHLYRLTGAGFQMAAELAEAERNAASLPRARLRTEGA